MTGLVQDTIEFVSPDLKTTFFVLQISSQLKKTKQRDEEEGGWSWGCDQDGLLFKARLRPTGGL